MIKVWREIKIFGVLIIFLFFGDLSLYSDYVYRANDTILSGMIIDGGKDFIILKDENDKKEKIYYDEIVFTMKKDNEGKSIIELPPFKKSITLGLDGMETFSNGFETHSGGISIGYMFSRKFEFLFSFNMDKTNGKYSYGGTLSKTYNLGINYYFFPSKKNYLEFLEEKTGEVKVSRWKKIISKGIFTNPVKIQKYSGVNIGITQSENKKAGIKDKDISIDLTLIGVNYFITKNAGLNWNIDVLTKLPANEPSDWIISMNLGLRFRIFSGE